MESLRELYEERAASPIPRHAPGVQQWRKAEIKLCSEDYSLVSWKGYVKEGLAVHRVASAAWVPTDAWTITHIESGLRFTPSYTTRREAIEKADQLLCIEGLWANPIEVFRKGLREVDAQRINTILGTRYRSGHVGSGMKRYLEYRASQREG